MTIAVIVFSLFFFLAPWTLTLVLAVATLIFWNFPSAVMLIQTHIQQYWTSWSASAVQWFKRIWITQAISNWLAVHPQTQSLLKELLMLSLLAIVVLKALITVWFTSLRDSVNFLQHALGILMRGIWTLLLQVHRLSKRLTHTSHSLRERESYERRIFKSCSDL
jgi:hypothetical protein